MLACHRRGAFGRPSGWALSPLQNNAISLFKIIQIAGALLMPFEVMTVVHPQNQQSDSQKGMWQYSDRSLCDCLLALDQFVKPLFIVLFGEAGRGRVGGIARPGDIVFTDKIQID